MLSYDMTDNQKRKYSQLLAQIKGEIEAAERLIEKGDLRALQDTMFTMSGNVERIHEAVSLSLDL